MKKKLLKIFFILIVIVIVVPVLTLMILLRTQRDLIREEVVLFLNEQVEGELSIQGLDYSALKGFPDLQVEVKNLLMKKDSVPVLKIGHLFVHLSPVDLFGGDVVIEELGIEDALLISVVDSLGNKPRLFVQKKDSGPSEKSSKLIKMDEIRLVNTQLVLGNDLKHNRKYIHINEGKFDLNSNDSMLVFEGSVDGRLDTLIANNNVLFKGQPARGENIVLEINRVSKELALTGGELYANDLKLIMRLRFTPHEDGQMTLFTIDGEDDFNSFLDVFELHTNLDLEQTNPSARLLLSYKESGFVNPFVRPYSDLRFMISDAKFSGKALPYPVHLESLSGSYNNGESRSPQTVELIIDTLDAEIAESSVQARFKLSNLQDPVIDAHLIAKLELGHFIKPTEDLKLSGTVEADLRVDGKISEIREMHLSGKQSATGTIDVSNLMLHINDEEYTLQLDEGFTLLNNHILEVTSLVGAFNESAFHFQGQFKNLDHYLTSKQKKVLGAFELNFNELDITAIDFASFKKDKQSEKADYAFKDLAFDFILRGDKIITPFGPVENVKLNCRLDGNELNINTLNFDYQEGWVNGKGRLSFGETGIQHIHAALKGDFKSLNIKLPERSTEKNKGDNPKSILPDDINIDLDFSVKEGSVQDFGFKNFRLKSSLVKEYFFLEKFEADIFEGHASLNGKARLKEMALDGVWLKGDLKFKQLDLTRLFPAGSGDGETEMPPFPEEVDIDIDMESTFTTYYDAELRDLIVKVKATNDILQLEELSAILPFGHLKIDLAVEQYRKQIPEYSGSINLDIDTISMDDLLAMKAFNQPKTTDVETKDQDNDFFLAGLPDFADVKVNVTAGKVSYENAEVENLELEGGLVNKGIELEKLKLNFAGGNIDIHGNLKRNDQGSYPGYIYSRGDEIDIQRVLLSFDNFNQDLFTSENSSGRLSTASHYYFMLDENFIFQVPENLWLLNVFVYHAEFDHVEPIEKTLFFVGHKSKDQMLVHKLNLNAYVIGDNIYFRDIYMNDNIADLGVFGEVDTKEMTMDLALELSLTDLFFRTRKKRMQNTKQGLYNLDKDSKLFLRLVGPLHDHKMRKINKRKFNNYWDEIDAQIRSTTDEFREKNNGMKPD